MHNEKKKHIIKVHKENDFSDFKLFEFNDFEERDNLRGEIKHLEKNKDEIEKRLKNEIIALKKSFELRDDEFKKTLELEKKKSYDQGFLAGKNDGIKIGKDSILESANYLKNTSEKIIKEQKNYIKESEVSLVKLSCFIAEKIVGKAVLEDDLIILHSIKNALNVISDKSKIVVKLNESDLNTVKENIENIRMIFDDVEGVKLVIDNKIEKGGTIIETNSGIVDSRLKTEFEEIYNKLLDEASK